MATLTNSPAEATVLEVEARKSLAFTVEIATPSGVPADLTGASVGFVLGVGTTSVEVPAVIDMPASGRAVVMLQAATLALDPGPYPFVVVLRTGGYSLVLVKGEVKVKPNPEQLSAALTYGGANPATGLSVALVGLQVIKVTVWSGVPQGVDGGLDATGVADGYLPTAQGDGTWAWQPPAVVQWDDVVGTDAVVLRPELDAYAPLAGAAFTGAISAPAAVLTDLEAGDAAVGLELRVGPTSSQLSMAYGTISATEDGVPVDVSFPTGITDLPVPIDPDDAVTKAYADARLVEAKAYTDSKVPVSTGWVTVPGWDSVNWTYYSGTATAPGTNKTGRTVEFRATLKPNSTAAVSALNGTTAGATRICTLPSALWPSTNVYSIQGGSAADRYLLVIATDGAVGINRYGPSAATTSTWLPMYCNFISAT